MNRARAQWFWLHVDRFDAPGGRVWAVQVGDRYLTAREVVVSVPLTTVYRATAKHPNVRAYLRGRGVVRRRPGLLEITSS